MPLARTSAISTLRFSLVAALVCLSGALGPAGAQGPGPVPPVKPKLPPSIPNLTNRSLTVTIPRLDPGQTITQNFSPDPSPATAPAIMSLNGEWPVAIVSGGEGQVNRKIRAILRSPFGQIIANGCGYSRDAKPVSGSSESTPALLATGQFQAGNQDVSGGWNVSVTYCDNLPSGPMQVSRVLGEIKIFVSYRAATS